MPIFLPALGLATLVAVNTDGAGPEARVPAAFRWDARVMRWRAPACPWMS